MTMNHKYRRAPRASGRWFSAVAERPAMDPLEKTSKIIAAAQDAPDMRRRLGAAALELDVTSDGSDQTRRRATVAARLPSQHWPQTPLLIVAVDAHTGEPVVFDRHSGVDLVDAVAASTAGPGAPPYSIGANRYIDGGYRRNENADLAAGYGRVLVFSPFGGRSRMPQAGACNSQPRSTNCALAAARSKPSFQIAGCCTTQTPATY